MHEFEIAPGELAQELRTNPAGVAMLDVREPWEWDIAHIEGSKLIPMGELASRVFQEIDPEAHIVAICHSGVRSMKVTVWMREQGFNNVQSLRGGIEAWAREVDPRVPRY